MGGALGNKNGTAIKSPKLMEEAFADFCRHMAAGKSKRGWSFKHPECKCTYQTLEKYMKDQEFEFEPITLEIAKSDGFGYWEGVLHDAAVGKNKDGNPAVMQMIMRNKYSWDKNDKTTHVDATIVDSFDSLMKMFQAAQSSRKMESTTNINE